MIAIYPSVFLLIASTVNSFCGRKFSSNKLDMHLPSVLSGKTVFGQAESQFGHLLSSVLGSACILFIHPNIATAGIDMSQLKEISKVQKSIVQEPANISQVQSVLDSSDQPFTLLPSGVSYRIYRVGKGSRTIEKGSIVSVEMTARCRSLATQKDPGGIQYYNTKIDTPDNQLTWVIGDGQLSSYLEDGLIGMKRGEIRRIEVPSVLVFGARKLNQLPLPSKDNTDGVRRFKNLFKTDATLLFEILVDRIVPPSISN